VSNDLETVSVIVTEAAVEPFEAALASACRSVSLFLIDETERLWLIEGVRQPGRHEPELSAALAVAGLVSGEHPTLQRQPTPATGWLARTQSSFPEQQVGRRFAIRGTHLPARPGRSSRSGRTTLILDAGVAFGSGEHGSTRGCLRALERVATRRPRRVLDLGCGSGILAMAAARLLGTTVLATDIDTLAVRTARQNAVANGLRNRVQCRLAVGWQPAARARAPYDLVFGNILARPLCLMAPKLSHYLALGGLAILAGLLASQQNMVIAAHRRCGLVLDFKLCEGAWTTLVLRKPQASS
jgi:ribosomal protein L11 methyltransferase